jgi:hypothetical protein
LSWRDSTTALENALDSKHRIRYFSIVYLLLHLVVEFRNLIGELPNYEYVYRTFLVIVEMVFLALIVWYAWRWPKLEIDMQKGQTL